MTMNGSHILGTGRYIPEKVLTNDDLSRMVDTTDEWITERTGIKERHLLADGELTSDLAVEAGRRALDAAGLDPEDLDMIILGTISGDTLFPATACSVQHKLGARKIPSFDISAACCGFIYGLAIADSLIAVGRARYILVVGVEALSRLVDWTDRNTCILFADGAGAAILGPGEKGAQGELIATRLASDGRYKDLIIYEAGGSEYPFNETAIKERRNRITMKGNETFKLAVQAMTSVARETLEQTGLETTDVDLLIPHQANTRIINAVAKRLRLNKENVYINIHKYGNTSAGSIPIALDEAVRNGVIRRGHNVLMVAFGGGLTWAGGLLRW